MEVVRLNRDVHDLKVLRCLLVEVSPLREQRRLHDLLERLLAERRHPPPNPRRDVHGIPFPMRRPRPMRNEPALLVRLTRPPRARPRTRTPTPTPTLQPQPQPQKQPLPVQTALSPSSSRACHVCIV